MTARALAQLRDIWLTQREAAIVQYRRQPHPEPLLARLCEICDQALQQLTVLVPLPGSAALVAVGGYGRGELYPHSDVDILILLDHPPSEEDTTAIQHLVAAMWDVGLKPSHSVRTLADCLALAARDVTTETALLESRWLAGNRELATRLRQDIIEQLDPQQFFLAKCAEMQARHAHFHDTPYALEPNCKESPGALRDLQLLSWLAQASGFGSSWSDVVDNGAITASEYRSLRRAQRAFSQLRIELHLLTGRREDRVLFDLQPALARIYGFQPTKTRLPSEILMQRYYWAARVVSQLSTILIQSIKETLFNTPTATPRRLNDDFCIINGRLGVYRTDSFARNPALIFRAFLWLQQRPDLEGMSARTLRAIWHARRRIDAQFRRNPVNQDLFLRILKQPRGVADSLYRMSLLNILPRYLPAFRRITGQMQHDLFHAYTVDEHTLKVIRNLRGFLSDEGRQQTPLAGRLMAHFDKPWLLYLAALFHDIAKGRSAGNHAVLGAVDAKRFCRGHRLDEDETALVVFLVEHHLLMSTVAQKRDLSDPDVVQEFAGVVEHEERLNALYLLTVADIRATNPGLWNSWKGKLLDDLHRRTLVALAGRQPDTSTVLHQRKEDAASKILALGLSESELYALWDVLDTAYFLRHEPDEMVWHAQHIAPVLCDRQPMIHARVVGQNEALQVLVLDQDRSDLFASICRYFDQNAYNVQDARIHTTRDGWALDSFIVLTRGAHANYADHVHAVKRGLGAHLRHHPPARTGIRQASARRPGPARRQVRTFPITPHVDLQPEARNGAWRLSVVCADRPGLLYDLATLFSRHGINLKMAKIHTLGERVEDVFTIEGNHLADADLRTHFEHAVSQTLVTHP